MAAPVGPFVSYFHDSAPCKARVLKPATDLRAPGVRATSMFMQRRLGSVVSTSPTEPCSGLNDE
jgi:hypothetical protein